jgi:aryl-alcohol dehydrogenase-like predicted oxidoreductase
VAAVTVSTRRLGRTRAQVTILGFGAMELRGQPRGPAITDDDAGRVLNAVLDGGINLIDTSVDYGRSEELISRYLSDRRDEYFLASKCGCPLEPPPDLEFMLRFTLSHPGLSTTVVGTASVDHLRSNLAVAEKGPLPDAVYTEAMERLASAER